MICCLNLDCPNPLNPDLTKFCQACGQELTLLRNRYRAVKPLGAGGFGKTYLAEDVDKLNELCVIKQLAPNVQGAWALKKATELFEQEGQRLQQLGVHPQIPNLLAYFEESSQLFLVQEYIPGQNLLEELNQRGTFNESEIRALLLDLLPILDFVHEHKIIHRDIKPQNIIRDEEDGKLVLIDFGIAKKLTFTNLAQPGTTIGSYGYVSAEQMHGGKACPGFDLYSLGTTCFHLLTGVHPRELWAKESYHWVDNWQAHVSQPLGPELSYILGKLLQRSAQQRYQTAKEVMEDMHKPLALLHNTPTIAIPNGSTVPFNAPTKAMGDSQNTPIPSVAQKNFFQKKIIYLLSAGFIALSATQIYNYSRFGIFPSHPFWIISHPSRIFLKKTLRGHQELVNSVLIAPKNDFLFSGSSDRTLKIWNLKTGEIKLDLTDNKSGILALAMNFPGTILASAGNDGKINLWDTNTGELLQTLNAHGEWVNGLAISRDGETLVSASADKTVKIWQLQSGKLLHTLTDHRAIVLCLAISRDGKTLITSGADKTIKTWDLKTGELLQSLTSKNGLVLSMVITNDGNLISGTNDGSIQFWSLERGEMTDVLLGHNSKINALALSPDGKRLISGSEDKTIKVWDVQSKKNLQTFSEHTNAIRSLAISPQGKIFASGSADNTIKIWQIP